MDTWMRKVDMPTMLIRYIIVWSMVIMTDTLDMVCPHCKVIVNNICILTADWMLVMYAKDYIQHVDNCKRKPL